MIKALAEVLKAFANNHTKAMSFLISFSLVVGIISYIWTLRLDKLQTSIAFWIWFAASIICMILGYIILIWDEKIKKQTDLSA